MSESKPLYPSRTADQFVVRFPDGMRDRLKEAAHENGRSMNAEIVSRLSASFDQSAWTQGTTRSAQSDRLHQSFGSLLDTGALQQQLETTTKSLRLHEDATLIMHGLLNALLNEIPPDREEALVVKIVRSFQRASWEKDMVKARAAWDALMEAGDPTILLAQAAPSPKPD